MERARVARRVIRAAAALLSFAACTTLIPDRPPVVELRAERRPDHGGWYDRPVRVHATVRDERGLRDVCFVDVENLPRGASVSAVRLPCDEPDGRSWSRTKTLRTEARHIVQLSARDSSGQESRAPMLEVRIDPAAPVSRIDGPEGPFAGLVRLTGDVLDDSSGVAEVTLGFRSGTATMDAVATCVCPSDVRRDRPPEPWTWEGSLEPGRWTVTVRAADHAGNREDEGVEAGFEVR